MIIWSITLIFVSIALINLIIGTLYLRQKRMMDYNVRFHQLGFQLITIGFLILLLGGIFIYVAYFCVDCFKVPITRIIINFTIGFGGFLVSADIWLFLGNFKREIIYSRFSTLYMILTITAFQFAGFIVAHYVVGETIGLEFFQTTLFIFILFSIAVFLAFLIASKFLQKKRQR